MKVYKKVRHSSHSIPDYFRIMLSTRLAKNGNDWIRWMNHINTGMYNSQWMILDTNKARKSIG